MLGGYVTAYLDWYMVFYLDVTPGMLCMLLVVLVLPNTRGSTRRSRDLAGLGTMTLYMVALLTALSQGHRLG